MDGSELLINWGRVTHVAALSMALVCEESSDGRLAYMYRRGLGLRLRACGHG